MTPLTVVQFGLGPIGLATIRAVLRKESTNRIALVGAIDIDPSKVGRDAGELAGGEPIGITVEGDAETALARLRPDVVLHTTTSFLPNIEQQLVLCARMGSDVVSSTEELSYPFDRHPDVSERLDQVARECGITLLGTGVNPGYAMDTLALTATGVCLDVRHVLVEREVDAALRRLPLQKKVGAGITIEVFRERQKTGTFGHIGLLESIRMLAAGLGWKLDAIDEQLDPVVAEKTVETPFLVVHPGEVAGIHHVVRGTQDGREVLCLDLQMYVGASHPRDSVFVDGDPPIELVVQNGIFGDSATVAALINAAPLVHAAKPGLLTMKDLPVPRAFGTQ